MSYTNMSNRPKCDFTLCLAGLVVVSILDAQATVPDANYQALREAVASETYPVENIELMRDVAKLSLRSGAITFFKPVQDRRMLAVFRGEGVFDLNPATKLDRDHLARLTGKDKVSVPFQRSMLAFSDSTYEEIKSSAKQGALDGEAAQLLDAIRKKIRKTTNDNIEAELLAALYNPKREPFFSAYLSGRGADDLRFFVKPWGAIASLSPEEVGLMLEDRGDDRAGIWYLSHRESELKSGQASSAEEKASIHIQHFTIDATIGGNASLSATATAKFQTLADGERVIPLELVPPLRVRKGTYDGREIPFIQEKKEEDAGLYLILPEPVAKGGEHTVSVEYAGEQVIEKAGGGNFYVGARESWYPNAGAFRDRATFDLTFRYPKRYTLVSVGQLVNETEEKDTATSHWKSDLPLAVAGFNYGEFNIKSRKDPQSGFELQALTNDVMPDYMRSPSDSPTGTSWSPARLADQALAEADASLHIFTQYFGPTPFTRLSITQQPALNFGQSWPTLIYLPVIAFLDSTQRWKMFDTNSFKLTSFILEVTPHEVSHQWWGHSVGWSSYHDQWLSEGFADFSASLFLQATRKTSGDFQQFWERQRHAVLDKNEFGRSANDAGPIWMGLRLGMPKNPGAYNRVVYAKGAYVLHMLRQLMWDAKSRDENFIAMMKDFVSSYQNKNATTEGFKAVVEKHMTPGLDLEGNHKMDWFFRDWVYGNEVPRYHLEYSFVTGENGQVRFKGKLTQNGVGEDFKMVVPVYLEVPNGVARLGLVPVKGSTPAVFDVGLPSKPKRAFLNANQDVLAYDTASTETK